MSALIAIDGQCLKINSEPKKAFLPIFVDKFPCIYMKVAINNVISAIFMHMLVRSNV